MTSPAAGVLVDAEIFNNGMSCLSSNLHIDAKEDSSDCKFKGKVVHRPSPDYKVYVGADSNVQTVRLRAKMRRMHHATMLLPIAMGCLPRQSVLPPSPSTLQRIWKM